MSNEQKLYDQINSAFTQGKVRHEINRTDNGYRLLSKEPWTHTLLFLILVFLPPIAIIQFENSLRAELMAIVWILIFSYRLLKIVVAETEIIINTEKKLLFYSKSNILLKHWHPKSAIPFEKIEKFSWKEIKHARTGIDFRVSAVLVTGRKFILADLNDRIAMKQLIYFLNKLLN